MFNIFNYRSKLHTCLIASKLHKKYNLLCNKSEQPAVRF